MNRGAIGRDLAAEDSQANAQAGVFSQSDELNYQILRFLNRQSGPVGAGKIRAVLSGTTLSKSEAAIGRILRRFQEEGHVRRLGFQGQAITDRGQQYLRHLENERHLQDVAQSMISRIKENHGEMIFSVLHARRAIETEAARLATERATEEEILTLGQNLDNQKKQLAARKSNAELNKRFHYLIVGLSRDRLLISMYKFIGLNMGLARVFERSRINQGSFLGEDHIRIFRAIQERDRTLAAAEVSRHIEKTIEDTKQYLASYNSSKAKE